MGKETVTKIVISAVNFTSGGPLSVLLDCLQALKNYEDVKLFDVTVLVHKRQLVSKYLEDFNILEFPNIKSSWIKRLKFEYSTSLQISKELKPKIWISLHDMTPNVEAEIQYVYCHNPSPFYSIAFKEIKLDFKFFLFNKFYKYLYSVNIKKNKFVIVQQNWLREKFEKDFNVDTIVAYPKLDNQQPEVLDPKFSLKREDDSFLFFFPSFPRIFKNFEVILEAASLLSKTRKDFKVIVTISGFENKYSKMLLSKYGNVDVIDFVGEIKREKVFEYYNQVDCLLFPSKLETWGLPITEFKLFNKPMLVADLPYAHETVGEYAKVKFFESSNAVQLAAYMDQSISNQLIFDNNEIETTRNPFFNSWTNLIPFLINNNNDENFTSI